MKILVYSSKEYEKQYLIANNHENSHELEFINEKLSVSTTNLTKGYDAICCFVSDKVDKDIIPLLVANGIKLILLRSAGFDHIDIASCKANNISVARVPEYSPYAIAEHAMGLILALNRRLNLARNNAKQGKFALDKLIGFDLHNKTVGIIGAGKIGTIFCKIAAGFSCKVIIYDPNENDDCKQAGASYVSIDTLLKNSDIISLHCPLNEHTKNLINKETIATMKTGVTLINTSRGAVINTADAIEGIKNGKIGFMGLDVYEKEAGLFFYDHNPQEITDPVFKELLTFDNVIITGHQAFLTHEALVNIANTTLNNATAFANNSYADNIRDNFL